MATVTTLEAEAFVHRLGGTPVCAALDAGREQLAWALFEERQGQLHQTGSERITGPANMLRSLPSPALICGEALERHGEALSETVPKGVRLALPYLPGQRLLAVAYLGTARIKAGLVQEPATIQPLYLRRPTITEPRRQSSAAAPDAGGTSLTGTVR